MSAAMRILPEWKGYDDEIRELQKKIDSGVLDEDGAIENGELNEQLQRFPLTHPVVPDTTDRHTEL